MPKKVGKVRQNALKKVLSANSSLRSGTKHWASSHGDLYKAMDKWAQQESNQTIQTVFSSMMDLNTSWTDAITQHNQSINKFRETFNEILNQEKAVFAAQKALATAQKNAKKLDKTVASLAQKGKSTAAAQIRARSAAGIEDMCSQELEEAVSRTEEAKVKMIRESIVDCSKSYASLMKRGIEVFQAQQDLANLIPDNPLSQEASAVVTSSGEIVARATSGSTWIRGSSGRRNSSINVNRRSLDNAHWARVGTEKSHRPSEISGGFPSPPKDDILPTALPGSVTVTSKLFDEHLYAEPDKLMGAYGNEVSFNMDSPGLDISRVSMQSVGAGSWNTGSLVNTPENDTRSVSVVDRRVHKRSSLSESAQYSSLESHKEEVLDHSACTNSQRYSSEDDVFPDNEPEPEYVNVGADGVSDPYDTDPSLATSSILERSLPANRTLPADEMERSSPGHYDNPPGDRFGFSEGHIMSSTPVEEDDKEYVNVGANLEEPDATLPVPAKRVLPTKSVIEEDEYGFGDTPEKIPPSNRSALEGKFADVVSLIQPGNNVAPKMPSSLATQRKGFMGSEPDRRPSINC